MTCGLILVFIGVLFLNILSSAFLIFFDEFVEWLERREGEKYDNK